MKKVLMMTPTIPDDNGWGVQRRAINHFNALADSFDLDLLIITHLHKSDVVPEHLAVRCQKSDYLRVEEYPPLLPSTVPGFAFISEIFRPSYKRNMPSPEQLAQIADFINQGQYDSIFCFRIRTAITLDYLEAAGMIHCKYQKIVDFDDIESIAMSRELNNKRSEIGIEYATIQKLRISRLQKLEKQFLAGYDKVILCSENDKQRIQALNIRDNIEVVPNCVDMPEREPCEVDPKVIKILFVGTMSYLPNEDGVNWFVTEIYPEVVKASELPVELYLVGFNPPAYIRDFNAIDGVTVTGGVDSVQPYYEMCDFVVAPIRFGGGTRIKILESLSYGKATISTTVGSEGIDITHAENIFLADDQPSFVQACIDLVNNPDLRQSLGENGIQLIEQKYTLRAFTKHVIDVVNGVDTAISQESASDINGDVISKSVESN